MRLRHDLGKAGCVAGHGDPRGGDRLAGPDMLQPIDDNDLARGKTLPYNAETIDFGPQLNESVLDPVVAREGQYKLLG